MAADLPAPNSPPPRGPWDRIRELPLLPCLAFWAMSSFSLVAGQVVSGSSWSEDSVPKTIQGCLHAVEMCAIASLVVGVSILFALLDRLGGRWTGRVGRIAVPTLRVLLVGTVVFFYLGSWTLFWATGQFFDERGLEFLATNGRMVVSDAWSMNPGLVIGVPAAAAVVSTGAFVLGPRLAARVSRSFRSTIALGSCGALALAAIAWAGAEGLHSRMQWTVQDIHTGIQYPAPTLYRLYRDFRTGPLTHVLSSLWRDREPAREDLQSLPLVRRRRVAMDDYAKDIAPDAARRWNVVVVLIDSLRTDQLKSYGGSRDVMPRLDALARESRVFLDARTEASHTDYAAVVPLSSHYPLRSSKIHRYPKKPPYPRVLLYDVLKAVGYRTALISSQDENWGRMINYLDTGGLDHLFYPGGSDGNELSENVCDDALTIDEAIRWTRGCGEHPFFLSVNLQNAHFPYNVPPQGPRPFGGKKDFVMTFGHFPPERNQDVRNLYADALHYSDLQLARLWDDLRARGVWDKTLVVVSADHGEAFFEHGFAAHASSIYDEVMRVPLIVRTPGGSSTADRRPAGLLDIAPTVLQLLGLPPHPSFQGIGLAGPEPAAPRTRYMVAQTLLVTQYGLERDGWKLISGGAGGVSALYDLKHDPLEKIDRSMSQGPLLRDLTARLAAWKAAQLDYYADPARMAAEYPPVVDER
jgi:arylsulfatase A-like enzyme